MSEKKKYKGTFNWFGEIHTEYEWAFSKKQAFNFMVIKIADKVGYNKTYVRNHFLGSDTSNYQIEEIK
jgi:hypothetical protein